MAETNAYLLAVSYKYWMDVLIYSRVLFVVTVCGVTNDEDSVYFPYLQYE